MILNSSYVPRSDKKEQIFETLSKLYDNSCEVFKEAEYLAKQIYIYTGTYMQ